MRLYLVASKPTDSVTYGFLPAAHRLGLDVTVLTDQPDAHERAYARARRHPALPFPEGSGQFPEGSGQLPEGSGQQQCPGPRIVPCDVRDYRALIAAATARPRPDGLFSNSDHLQAQTALAADYLGLPGKDWRSALRAKDKGLMRRRLAAEGVEAVRITEIRGESWSDSESWIASESATGLAYPVVLKPAQGVASEDVVLVRDAAELRSRASAFFRRHPGDVLLAEEFLPGTLRTLETLGDGVTRWTLGGFRTTVSAPPYFIEERLTWDSPPPPARAHVESALDALGVSFGACHTEYVTGPATRLIEVNDRVIGDHCDFLLAHVSGLPLFDLILRVHLGERLPAGPPAAPPDRGYAVADYPLAETTGVLAEVPPAAARHAAERPGVTLAHWPLRERGDQVTVTGTNRDYLAVISAAGPDQAAVDAAVAAARARLRWDIRPVSAARA
ncbi:MAG TPA: siderophore biosynthesis protein [Trebonia sp.]|jgi:biotin carboxylase|nr:siderophore biosynthesis protein [Trebonia sp.]